MLRRDSAAWSVLRLETLLRTVGCPLRAPPTLYFFAFMYNTIFGGHEPRTLIHIHIIRTQRGEAWTSVNMNHDHESWTNTDTRPQSPSIALTISSSPVVAHPCNPYYPCCHRRPAIPRILVAEGRSPPCAKIPSIFIAPIDHDRRHQTAATSSSPEDEHPRNLGGIIRITNAAIEADYRGPPSSEKDHQ